MLVVVWAVHSAGTFTQRRRLLSRRTGRSAVGNVVSRYSRWFDFSADDGFEYNQV